MDVGITRNELEVDEVAEADRAARIVSVSDFVMAASFNEVAFPPGFENANRRMLVGADRYGDFSFTNGGGRVTEINGLRYDVHGKPIDDDAANDDAGGLASAADHLEHERAREREQWATTQHQYFGVKLTGKQWGELADDVESGGTLHQRLVERLMKQGKSHEEAEAKADEMAKIYRILAKPESQWTEEERKRVEIAKADPDFTRNTKWVEDIRQGKSYGAVNEVEQTSTRGAQKASVTARADILDNPIAAPLDLVEHHQASLAATEPLDAPKADVQIAAITKPAPTTAAPGGGFES